VLVLLTSVLLVLLVVVRFLGVVTDAFGLLHVAHFFNPYCCQATS
jgi:hypothetical protein